MKKSGENGFSSGLNLKPSVFSWRRLFALCRKEVYQIVRDPSSIAIAVVLPVILLLIFGFGISLDSNRLRLGVVLEDEGAYAHNFVAAVANSPYIDAVIGHSRDEMQIRMADGEVRGMLVVPSDFSDKVAQHEGKASALVLTDGSQPNTAHFVKSYAQGALLTWQASEMRDAGLSPELGIDIEVRYWFNPTTVSRNYLIPGGISVIMTIIGALLTSLVIAREWERGTMEALLGSPMTRLEFLLSKILPYYALGMLAMLICVAMAIWLMHVPMRGSLLVMGVTGSLFLGSALGLGLFISSVTREQFNAAQAALNAAFLPAALLSGFMFEIASMPAVVRAVTYIIPAKYFVIIMQTLFQAGQIWPVIVINSLFLMLMAIFWLCLTVWKTRRRLDG